MPKSEINDGFIKEYARIYDEHEQDNQEYTNIRIKVKKELSQRKTPTEDTFIDIYEWLLPPFFRFNVEKGLKLYGYSKYEEGIKKALYAQTKNEKMSILDDLYGIGIVTASTILHFIYPSEFPIMNIRVVETLLELGSLKDDTRSIENYALFCKVINDISQTYRYEFRDIDKALFEYAVKMKSSNPN